METKKDIKVSVFLDKEMASFIDENKTYGMRRSDYMRGLVWEKMKRKKVKERPLVFGSDPFATPELTPSMIPRDLIEYTDLITEWWAVRHKNRATCSTKVAERIFKKLRTFTPQAKKIALEKAIAGGWKDIYEIKESYKTEEPKNHPNQKIFRASDSDMPPTLKELGLDKAMNGEK